MSGDRPWLGNLYRVALYSRALSADEIAYSFAAGLQRDTSNETSGSTAVNTAVNTNVVNTFDKMTPYTLSLK